jgi:hypothetical protein
MLLAVRATLFCLAVALTQCGTSFAARGQVTSCADDRPLEGASVGLQTLKPAVDMHDDTTPADGTFAFEIKGVPPESPATITVQKSGYQTVEKKYPRAPSAPETICLEPTRR